MNKINIDALVGLGEIDDLELDYAINGLGAMIKAPFTPAQKSGVAKLVKQQTTNALIATSVAPAARFIMSQADKLGKQVQSDMAQGKSRFMTRDYYFRRKIVPSAGQTAELLKQSDVIKVGIQNLDKNYFPEGENIAIDKIKFSYGFDAAGSKTNPDEVDYSNATESMFGVGSTTTDMASDATITQKLVDTLVLNGELKIFVEGGEVLSLPVKKFFRDKFSMSTQTEGNDDCVHLECPIMVKQNQRVGAILYYATNGTAIVTRTHFVELRLMGVSTAPRTAVT